MNKKSSGCLWYFVLFLLTVFLVTYIFCKVAPNTAKNAKNEVISRFVGSSDKIDSIVIDTTRVEQKTEAISKSDEYVTVPSNVYDNVFYVIADVNGAPIRFLLDTGCSDIQITSAEFYYLKHMGLVCDSDLVDSVKCTYANGIETMCPSINIKTLKIGDVEVNDVTCVIQNDVNAPLLLGQSILNKIGNVFIDFKEKTVKIKKV